MYSLKDSMMIGWLLNIHLLFYQKCPRKRTIEEDVEHWKDIFHWEGSYPQIIKRLLKEKAEFRNLFYYRLGNVKGCLPLLRWIAPPLSTLYIWTENIGGGLFIQHGFATVIAARSIGKYCFVNQQVTIGYISNDEPPVLGDNVVVSCGAKVLGNITVGDNVKIGANAVVTKNVPKNTTVVGIPAYIVKKNGERVYERL